MSFNSFGNLLKVTTYGESHGTAIGGIIDGFPAGLELDFDAIQKELNRRKPGQSKIVTQRKEPDAVEFLSGIFEGKTTGTSIGFIIRNTNLKITIIIPMCIDLLMQIIRMIKNLVTEITEVAEEVRLVKLPIG
jgi:chorismate synthase